MRRFPLTLCAGVLLGATPFVHAGAISDFFTFGDYVLGPGSSLTNYDPVEMRVITYYNPTVVSLPLLNKVLQTESGKFVNYVSNIDGLVNYSDELDKLVLTITPQITTKTCDIYETNSSGQIYLAETRVFNLAARYYELGLYVGGNKVTSTSQYASASVSGLPPYTQVTYPDVPQVYEFAIGLRRYLIPNVDSYLRLEIGTSTINCPGPAFPDQILAGPVITKTFEIDANNDTLPDYLLPWYQVKEAQYAKNRLVFPSISLLMTDL